MPDVQQRPAIDKLVQAGVALTSTQTFGEVLQTLVDTARDIVDARYAALGVLDPASHHLADFVTSGIARTTGPYQHAAGGSRCAWTVDP